MVTETGPVATNAPACATPTAAVGPVTMVVAPAPVIVNDLLTVTLSVYVPAATLIVSPGLAALTAA